MRHLGIPSGGAADPLSHQELRSLDPAAADEAQVRVLFQPGSDGARLTLRAYDIEHLDPRCREFC